MQPLAAPLSPPRHPHPHPSCVPAGPEEPSRATGLAPGLMAPAGCGASAHTTPPYESVGWPTAPCAHSTSRTVPSRYAASVRHRPSRVSRAQHRHVASTPGPTTRCVGGIVSAHRGAGGGGRAQVHERREAAYRQAPPHMGCMATTRAAAGTWCTFPSVPPPWQPSCAVQTPCGVQMVHNTSDVTPGRHADRGRTEQLPLAPSCSQGSHTMNASSAPSPAP